MTTLIVFALFLSFLGLLLFSVPIAVAMLGAEYVALSVLHLSPTIIIEKSMSQLSSFPLLAIPFFVLAGDLMTKTDLSVQLSDISRRMLGRLHGGLAYASVAAAMVFGGMTGSGAADTAAIGSVMLPVMEEAGYTRAFSASLLAAAGTLGPIIPPSIPMIIYASMVPSVSVTELFKGGILPGILLGLGLMVGVFWRVRNKPLARGEQLTLNLRSVLMAVPALVLPVIILGGIFLGLTTATEAGALAVLYALLYGFIRRQLTWTPLIHALRSTVRTVGMVGIIIAASGPFSWILAKQHIPAAIAAGLTSFTVGNRLLLLALVALFLLLMGCLVEATANIILLAPILASIAETAHINQIHMAILAVVTLMIGLYTPPVATNLFTIASIANISFDEMNVEVWPFVGVALVVIVLLILIPWLAIPNGLF